MVNLDINFAKWLMAAFSLKGNVSDRDYYQSSLAPVDYAYRASRAIPAYQDDGQYNYYEKRDGSTSAYKYNILNELDNSGVEQDGSSVTFDANFRFRFTDWLTANAIFSYTASNTTIDRYWGAGSWHVASLRECEYGEIPRTTVPFPREAS